MYKKLVLFLLILGFQALAFGGIYDLDYTKEDVEAEAVHQDGKFVKLRLQSTPQSLMPLFIYNIAKTKNPHKIPQGLFKESLFLLEKGNSYFSKGNYQKAIEFYQKAANVNPSFIAAYHNVGISFFVLNEYGRSREYFEKIISMEPLEGYPYFYLGWIYKKLENPRMAERYLNTAKEIFASQKELYLLDQTEKMLDSLQFFPNP
jgi:tetratricopeptide (TPR) repeat protein